MISLEAAIQKRDITEALHILEHDPAQAQANTKLGVSILMLALYYEVSELVVPIRSRLDSITFFEAAATGEIEAVKTALQADPTLCNAYAPDGFTVLGLAIFFRQPAIVDLLLAHGADVNLAARNARQVAPIHAACARQDLESLAKLLALGADSNAAQESGVRPLQQARASGNTEMERMLREAGAVEV